MLDLTKSINESYWRSMGETELENFVMEIFNHYRKNGFPYYPTDKKYRDKEFNKLIKFKRENMIQYDMIRQTMHGLGLAWLDGFLTQTLKNCYYGLKTNGYLVLNIGNLKTKNIKLAHASIDIARKIGFSFDKNLYLTLSNVNLRNRERKYKLEPVLVFIKK
jgi:hypothetical protein